jgi:hypothetical protein
MTVGELRKALEGVPDDLVVIRVDEVFLREVDEIRVSVVIEDDDHLGLGYELKDLPGRTEDEGAKYLVID